MDGKNVYVFVLKGNDHATYEKLRLYVDMSKLAAVKSEMMTAEDKMLKSATYEYGNTAPSRSGSSPMISKMVITDTEGKATTLTYSKPTFSNVSADSFRHFKCDGQTKPSYQPSGVDQYLKGWDLSRPFLSLPFASGPGICPEKKKFRRPNWGREEIEQLLPHRPPLPACG